LSLTPAETPFDLLTEWDRICRQSARGLPTGARVVDDWVGIGFRLCGEQLIAPMNEVSEILPMPDMIRVPGVRQWVRGLANIRGSLMPLLDMSQLLRGEPVDQGKATRVLVIDRKGVLAALMVEEVFGLRRFKPDMKQAITGQSPEQLEPYLDGEFADSQGVWGVFSVDRLVQHEQFMKVV
jgi:twitching motility protein PilI